MTQREKAVELFNKFWHIRGDNGQVPMYVARKSAKIAVAEILNTCSVFKRRYWRKVQQELERL
jgi:hypothetical protein